MVIELVVIVTMVRLVGTLHAATDGLAALPGPTSSMR
jgi:hypothetical protein